MTFTILQPPVAPASLNPAELATDAELQSAIAATEAKIEETEAIEIPWATSADVGALMAKDGVYTVTSSTKLPDGPGNAWMGLVNMPADAAITYNGKPKPLGSTNNNITIWGVSSATVYREGNKFDIVTSGERVIDNLRWDHNSSIQQAFYGIGDALSGKTTARWMAESNGSVQWFQTQAGTTFQAALDEWNKLIYPDAPGDYQITELRYNGVLADLTAALPTGLMAASWRAGKLLLQSLVAEYVTESLAVTNINATQGNTAIATLSNLPPGAYEVSAFLQGASQDTTAKNVAIGLTINNAVASFPGNTIASTFIPSGFNSNYPVSMSGSKRITLSTKSSLEIKGWCYGGVNTGNSVSLSQVVFKAKPV